ncbi:hypothetical protein ACYJW8_12495 [Frateuria aurantia]
MYIKLTVLGCVLGMSAGVVMASSLLDASSTRGAADGSVDVGLPRPAASAPIAATVDAKIPDPVGGGFEAPGLHALPARHPNAPLPPSWQSLLPGAIRL